MSLSERVLLLKEAGRNLGQDKHWSIVLALWTHSKFGSPLLRARPGLCLLLSLSAFTPFPGHVCQLKSTPTFWDWVWYAFQPTPIHSGRLPSFLGRETRSWESLCSDERAILVLFNCVLARLWPVSGFSLEPFCIILQYSACAMPRKLRAAGTLCWPLAWTLRALGTWWPHLGWTCLFPQSIRAPLQNHICTLGKIWERFREKWLHDGRYLGQYQVWSI